MNEKKIAALWYDKENLSQLLSEFTGDVRKIDANVITSANSLMTIIADAMNFPDYFAGNWDSFDECLADLELPASCSSVVLVIHNASQIFKIESAKTFFSIFNNAILEWSERHNSPSLSMILEGEADSEAIAWFEDKAPYILCPPPRACR